MTTKTKINEMLKASFVRGYRIFNHEPTPFDTTACPSCAELRGLLNDCMIDGAEVTGKNAWLHAKLEHLAGVLSAYMDLANTVGGKSADAVRLATLLHATILDIRAMKVS